MIVSMHKITSGVLLLAGLAGLTSSQMVAAENLADPKIIAKFFDMKDAPFEYWVFDQSRSDSNDLDKDGKFDEGGYVYIYDGKWTGGLDFTKPPLKIDLADVMFKATGNVGHRPHIGGTNYSKTHGHLSWFAAGTGEVNEKNGGISFYRLKDKTHVYSRFGLGALHMPGPSPDDKQFVGVATTQKKLHFFHTDWINEKFSVASDLDLTKVAGLSEGLGTSDVQPICAKYTPDSKHLFVTFRPGGAAIFNVADPANVKLTEAYSKEEVVGEGCSLIWNPDFTRMYTGSGAASANQTETGQEWLYVWDMRKFGDGNKNDMLKKIGLDPKGVGDNHGPNLVQKGRYLWLLMRADNEVKVIDTVTDKLVNTFSLVNDQTPNPFPDVLEPDPIDPTIVYISFRGNCVVSGLTVYVDSAKGDCPGDKTKQIASPGRTPGFGVYKVALDGMSAALTKLVTYSNVHNTDGKGQPRAPYEAVDIHAGKIMVTHPFLMPQ